MKKLSIPTLFGCILASAFMIFSIANADAQPRRPDPSELAKNETEMMKNNLELSKEQLVRVTEINERYAKMSSDLFSSKSSDREVMQKAMTELEDRKNEELKLVLSNEQFESWVSLKDEMRRNRPTPGGMGSRPNR